MEKLSQDYAKEAETLPEYAGKPKPSMYAYSLFYMYFEQYTYIKGVALQNILISLACLFGVVSVRFSLVLIEISSSGISPSGSMCFS